MKNFYWLSSCCGRKFFRFIGINGTIIWSAVILVTRHYQPQTGPYNLLK